MNVDEMQRKLSQKAEKEPEHQFENLYGLLCNEIWLRVAHHSVNSNQGRETAGIDGRTMSNFNGDVEGNLKRLQEALKAKMFEPLPVQSPKLFLSVESQQIEPKESDKIVVSVPGLGLLTFHAVKVGS